VIHYAGMISFTALIRGPSDSPVLTGRQDKTIRQFNFFTETIYGAAIRPAGG
jgi:hypothetical protein